MPSILVTFKFSVLIFSCSISDSVFVLLLAIHQDDDDALDDNQVRSPYGSSFRTFDGTDYSSIGMHTAC